MRVRLIVGISVGLVVILPSLAQNLGLFDAPQITTTRIAAEQPDVVAPLVVAQQPAAGTPSGSTPSRGTSMQQVEKDYGAPVDRRTPVGDPPITRWEYQTFVVYFEYRHVIHAVPKR